MKRTIKYIVVHCTASSPTATIESIQQFWKNELKWKNPGYHYIIKRNGEIVCINNEENISNGVAGNNKHSIHIAYIGGISKEGAPQDNRTSAQSHALFNKLVALSEKYPGAEILGHRDFSPDKNNNGVIEQFEWIKYCPCFNVREWLKNYVPDIGLTA